MMPPVLGNPVNRAMRRKKVRARYYVDADDVVGKPFTRKGVVHKDGRTPFYPSKNPNEPNHKRVIRQRILSGRTK